MKRTSSAARSAALGLVTARLQQRDLVKRLLGRLGFRTVHPIPTAWDYHFGRNRAYWVVVRLKDGSEVYGLFGPQSFAGDDPDERDLYVEAVFELTEGGEWAPREDTGGIIIKADEISTIEFRRLTETQNGQ